MNNIQLVKATRNVIKEVLENIHPGCWAQDLLEYKKAMDGKELTFPVSEEMGKFRIAAARLCEAATFTLSNKNGVPLDVICEAWQEAAMEELALL